MPLVGKPRKLIQTNARKLAVCGPPESCLNGKSDCKIKETLIIITSCDTDRADIKQIENRWKIIFFFTRDALLTSNKYLLKMDSDDPLESIRI